MHLAEGLLLDEGCPRGVLHQLLYVEHHVGVAVGVAVGQVHRVLLVGEPHQEGHDKPSNIRNGCEGCSAALHSKIYKIMREEIIQMMTHTSLPPPPHCHPYSQPCN